MSSFSRPVVFFANGIGDHLLVLPALRALVAIFGDSLRVVCMRRFCYWFLHELSVKPIKSEFIWQDGTRYFDVELMAAQIGWCDLFISLVPWYSKSLEQLMYRLKPAHSIGLSRYYKTRPIVESPHSVDRAFGVPRYFESRLAVEDFSFPPVLPARAMRTASTVRTLIPSNYRILAVQADTKREKTWPDAAFANVVSEFLRRHQNFVAMPVGLSGIDVSSVVDQNRLIPCNGAPLAAAMALVAQADFLLGVDSFALHVADLSRVPGVGLFGPTRPSEFGFSFRATSSLRRKRHDV